MYPDDGGRSLELAIRMYNEDPSRFQDHDVETLMHASAMYGIPFEPKFNAGRAVGNAIFNAADTALFGLLPDSLRDSLVGKPLNRYEQMIGSAGDIAGFAVPFGLASKGLGLGSKAVGKVMGMGARKEGGGIMAKIAERLGVASADDAAEGVAKSLVSKMAQGAKGADQAGVTKKIADFVKNSPAAQQAISNAVNMGAASGMASLGDEGIDGAIANAIGGAGLGGAFSGLGALAAHQPWLRAAVPTAALGTTFNPNDPSSLGDAGINAAMALLAMRGMGGGRGASSQGPSGPQYNAPIGPRRAYTTPTVGPASQVPLGAGDAGALVAGAGRASNKPRSTSVSHNRRHSWTKPVPESRALVPTEPPVTRVGADGRGGVVVDGAGRGASGGPTSASWNRTPEMTARVRGEEVPVATNTAGRTYNPQTGRFVAKDAVLRAERIDRSPDLTEAELMAAAREVAAQMFGRQLPAGPNPRLLSQGSPQLRGLLQ